MVQPERVIKYQLINSPCILIDDKPEFVGAPKEKGLRQRLSHA
ncbi:MAG: hypothetical protein QGH72_03295 [Dehalococcoidia bacterium]|jgi:hypothetical protein|nr:hypothetical protein [Dehalococcoidia bacterium]